MGKIQQKDSGRVRLPHALARKYKHGAWELDWQYLFPAKKLGVDPRSGIIRRQHVMESGRQKTVKPAKLKAGITNR